jgi:hypothetical protein
MNKGQVFTLDFLFAILIATVAVILSLKLVFNSTADEDFQLLQIEARAISNEFLSTGSPSNWTVDTVIIPGILTEGQLDKNKLDELNNYGYANATNALNTRYNFFFYFEDKDGIMNISNCGFGADIVPRNCALPQIDANDIAKLNRIVVNNNSAIKMVMLIWQ